MGTGQRRFGAAYQRADGRWEGKSVFGAAVVVPSTPTPGAT